MTQELELELSRDPSRPFKQPLLTLTFKKNSEGRIHTWYIDVDGDISRYVVALVVGVNFREDGTVKNIQPGSVVIKEPTRKLIEELAAQGLPVESVGAYEGSGGPDHVLLNGVLFKRASK